MRTVRASIICLHENCTANRYAAMTCTLVLVMKIAALIARLLLAFLGMPVLLLIGASKAHAISMLLIVLPVSAAGFLLLPLRQLPAWARWSAAILYVLWMLYVQTLTARFLVEDTP